MARRIGKYELEEYLGGGMSEVYRARDTVRGRTVAVKILTEKARENRDGKARFLEEARTAGSISHENWEFMISARMMSTGLSW